ncbi:MAG: DUF488 domain-containing protein [Verrucomicrobiota bacterium]|nr:DUF488 domain-containing protein [Verrucomicrobiota bacterium]
MIRSRKNSKSFPVVTTEATERPVEQQAVLTVGHSTRPIEEFIALLQAHGVTLVADVRTIPKSRHNPQFNKTSLPASLRKAGIKYVHLPGLGGLRHAKPDSPNLGWRNASFRGYADYMQTTEFAENFDHLIELAGQERVAIMCAEAVPWRCHRSLIGDALTIRGLRVEDIMTPTQRQLHRLTPFARVRKGVLTYPPVTSEQAEFSYAKEKKKRSEK